MKRSISKIVCLALITMAGCTQDGEWFGELSLESGCPLNECGANTAQLIDAIQIAELHLSAGQNSGYTNPWGVRISGFIAPDGSSSYTLRVDKGRLLASRAGQTLSGPQLIGATILVTDTTRNQTVEIVIHDHGMVPSWTSPDFAVDRYVFKTYEPDLEMYVPVCSDAVDLMENAAWSVLLSGERYSWPSKAVTDTGAAAAGWFNIACQGNGLYKMKMMGYDPDPTGQNPFQSTWQRRQGTLKMLTADYCGTGTSHTQTGTTVYWNNPGGWSHNHSDTPPGMLFEAYWSLDGAICLDTPREGASALSEIAAECAAFGRPLPPCDGQTISAYMWSTRSPE